MLRVLPIAIAAAGLMIADATWAQAPAGAPTGTTGQCKDGTYTSTATKKGACSGHKGVQTWYDGSGSVTGAAATAPADPASTAAPPPAAATSPAAAPGGGAGQVWVNKNSKVYHCPGDRYYGKTKSGAYMSQADAKAQGYRPDHGKVCQ
jgi:Protein of unknown function (DUF3761)